jgi:hypothetical protein
MSKQAIGQQPGTTAEIEKPHVLVQRDRSPERCGDIGGENESLRFFIPGRGIEIKIALSSGHIAPLFFKKLDPIDHDYRKEDLLIIFFDIDQLKT